MSAAVKTEAIVLRARRFSESSLTATLLGRECGRLDVLAKGCRREKSPLYGHLDLYQKEHVLVLRRPNAGLDLLTEAAFLDEHAGLRFLPAAFAAAGFLADFAAEGTLPGEPVPECYDVLASALSVLSGLGDAPARAGLAPPLPLTAGEKNILIGRTLKLALLDMLRRLGFGLELTRCAACGAPADAPGGGSISGSGSALKSAVLSPSRGGLVCGQCRKTLQDAAAVSVTRAALASLRDRSEGGEKHELALSPSERRRLLRFLVHCARYFLDRPLRAADPLFQLLD